MYCARLGPFLGFLLFAIPAHSVFGPIEPVGRDQHLSVVAGEVSPMTIAALIPSVDVSLEITQLPDPDKGLLYVSDCQTEFGASCQFDDAELITQEGTLLSGDARLLFYESLDAGQGGAEFDQFAYRIHAPDGISDEYLTVLDVWPADSGETDQAPLARTELAQAREDDPYRSPILLVASGDGTAEVEIHLVSLPAHGDLQLTADSDPGAGVVEPGALTTVNGVVLLWYRSDQHYNGPDSFEFFARSSGLDSDPVTVVVTVDPVNTRPIATSGPQTPLQGQDQLSMLWMEGENPDLEDDNPIHHFPLIATPIAMDAQGGRFYDFDGQIYHSTNPVTSYTPLVIGQPLTDDDKRFIYIGPRRHNSNRLFPQTFIAPAITYTVSDFELSSPSNNINIGVLPHNDRPLAVFSGLHIAVPPSDQSIALGLYGYDHDNLAEPLGDADPELHPFGSHCVEPLPSCADSGAAGDGCLEPEDRYYCAYYRAVVDQLQGLGGDTVLSLDPDGNSPVNDDQNVPLKLFFTGGDDSDSAEDAVSFAYWLDDSELASEKTTEVTIDFDDTLTLPDCTGTPSVHRYTLRAGHQPDKRIPLPGANLPLDPGDPQSRPDSAQVTWTPGDYATLQYELLHRFSGQYIVDMIDIAPGTSTISFEGTVDGVPALLDRETMLRLEHDVAADQPALLSLHYVRDGTVDHCTRWEVEMLPAERVGAVDLRLSVFHTDPFNPPEYVAGRDETELLRLRLISIEPDLEPGQVWAETQVHVEMPMPDFCESASWHCIGTPEACNLGGDGSGDLDTVVELQPEEEAHLYYICRIKASKVDDMHFFAEVSGHAPWALAANSDLDADLVYPVTLENDLALALDAPDLYRPGEVLEWTLTATNHGPSDLPEATLVGDLPAGCEQPQWSCTGINETECGQPSGSGMQPETVFMPVAGQAIFAFQCEIDAATTESLTLDHQVLALDPGQDPDEDGARADAEILLETRSIAVTVSPDEAGSASCDPNPVPWNQQSVCSASSGAAWLFIGWQGDCQGQSCVLDNVTEDKSVTAVFEFIDPIFLDRIPGQTLFERPRPSPFAFSGSEILHGVVNFLPCTAVMCPFSTFPAPNHEIQARQHPDRVRFIFGGEFD
jgi:hypothetical protein